MISFFFALKKLPANEHIFDHISYLISRSTLKSLTIFRSSQSLRKGFTISAWCTAGWAETVGELRSQTCRAPGRPAGCPARGQRLAARLAAGTAGKLYRARSRLYRNETLQVNMRLKALAEIYLMYSFAQLCNLKFLSKFCQKIRWILQNSAKIIITFFDFWKCS